MESNLGKFILKSIRNCRRYGSDKNLTFNYNLDLGPTRRNVSNGTNLHCDGEQLRQIILKSIHNCRRYGQDKFIQMDTHRHGRMQAHTPNYCCNNYVSLTASGLDKNDRKESMKKFAGYHHFLLFPQYLSKVYHFKVMKIYGFFSHKDFNKLSFQGGYHAHWLFHIFDSFSNDRV